jgi:Zn-dependent peptidase ImmA (M78 family)
MIKLDLMEMSDCFTPEQLVQEIYHQCPNLQLPIPVQDIAKAVGIHEIRSMNTDDLEGMLVADDGKNHGVIFYKENSPVGRQRFTIGHELGHFLLLHHGAKQNCLPSDIKVNSKIDNIHLLEHEANHFSQLLLMPDRLVIEEINRVSPSMESLKAIADKFEMSFEAISNKCASLSDKPFALIYSKDGVVRYCWRDWDRFTYNLPFKSGDYLPVSSQPTTMKLAEETISEAVRAIPSDWIKIKYKQAYPSALIEQTYTQLDGYQVTMLRLEF